MSVQKFTVLLKKRGFNLKSNFHILFKTYRDKVQMRSLGKNPANYETERKETCEYEQKPVSFDDFNDAEEEVKKRAEKRKARPRELAEHLKAQKQETKEGEMKVKEDQM